MIKDILYGEIQELRKKVEVEGLTVIDAKVILRAFRDKYKLTDRETLDLANRKI